MSSTYYAVPMKVVLDAGIDALFRETPEQKILRALRMLKGDEDLEHCYRIDDLPLKMNVEGVIEIGLRSVVPKPPKFTCQLSHQELDAILKGNYLIIDETSHHYQTAAEFRAELEEWGCKYLKLDPPKAPA